MKKKVGKMNQDMHLRDVSDKSLIDLRKSSTGLYSVPVKTRRTSERADSHPKKLGCSFSTPR